MYSGIFYHTYIIFTYIIYIYNSFLVYVDNIEDFCDNDIINPLPRSSLFKCNDSGQLPDLPTLIF